MATYIPPRLNIEATINLLGSDMCNLNSSGIGSATMKASSTRLVMPAAKNEVPTPLHVPSGMVLSQLYVTGSQSRKASILTLMRYAMLNAINT